MVYNELYIASPSRTSAPTVRKKKEKKGATMILPTRAPSSDRTLTPQELEWATSIRTAVHYHNANTMGGLSYDHISDLEYAQHAIVAKSNTEKALKRIQKIQAFKRANSAFLGSPRGGGITVYHAISLVQSFLDSHPTVLTSLGTLPPGTTSVVGFNPAGLQQQTQSTTGRDQVESNPDFPVIMFILFQALQADLNDIRAGTVWIGDLSQFSNSSSWMTFLKAADGLCRDAYPIRVSHVSILRASPWVRRALRVIKHIFSRKLQQALDVDDEQGHQSLLIQKSMPASALPPCCGGTQRPSQVMTAIRERLKKRYQMEETFRF